MPNFRSRSVAAVCAFALLAQRAAGADPAAEAINALGVDLYRQIAAQPGNLCLSPYSLSAALAMAMAGAEGETRTEMARVLYWAEKTDVDAAFAKLRKALAATTTSEPITLAIANRLFTQAGFALRPEFFARVKEFYGRRRNRWISDTMPCAPRSASTNGRRKRHTTGFAI